MSTDSIILAGQMILKEKGCDPMKIKHSFKNILCVLLILAVFCGSQAGLAYAAQRSGEEEGVSDNTDRVYFPITQQRSVQTPADPGNPGDPNHPQAAGAVWLPYTLPNRDILPTYGVSLAVDRLGGMHAAYAIYSGTDANQQTPATYAYCAAGCVEKANWSFVHLGDAVQEVRLALDPNGKPRLILFGRVYDPDFDRMRYQYAACDSACTSAGSWTVTTLVTPLEPVGTREYQNNRYFALDRLGRPAFVYTDTWQNDHTGTFYLSCQSNCTNASQWTETVLSSTALYYKPSLAFSTNNQPRLAFGFFDAENELYLAYAQCDQNCTDGENWDGLYFHPIHGTAMLNLQVDEFGKPRLALFSGSYATAPLESNQLYYLWCDSDCIISGSQWSLSNPGLPYGSGDGVDFVLDAQGRPRMSFQIAGDGLGYAWCNSNCESGSGIWQNLEVESQQSLADNYDVLPVQRCTVSTWLNGQRTSLALDKDGNPRIGYDAQHWWYGTEIVGGVPKSCNYQDVTVTRVAFFNQP
jgi:hypothetical protein